MTAFIDSSVIVRYLLGEKSTLGVRAARIVDSEEELVLTDVIVAETCFVLSSHYKVPRDTLVDHMIAFVQKKNIVVYRMDKMLVVEALLLSRPSARVSFADALLWAAARSVTESVVYSFDERFPSCGVTVKTIRVI